MATEIFAGKRVPKTKQNPLGWEDIDLNLWKSGDKPIVLCFGGDGTVTPKDANAMAKSAEQLLGRKGLETADDLEIVSIYYKDPNPSQMYNSRMYYLGLHEDISGQISSVEINPPYIDEFYGKFFKNLLFDEKGQPLEAKTAAANMNKINVFAYCHGHYVISKMSEKMISDMKEAGYKSAEIDKILKELAVVSIVPQADMTKTPFSEVGFGAIDDYHFTTQDSMELTDFYELDGNISSYLGIIERPRETKPGYSKLYVLDNMLDYADESDRMDAWLGKGTEDLHLVSSYIDLDFENKLGKKSEQGQDFARLIAKSLQTAVINSKNTINSEKLGQGRFDNLDISQKINFLQGSDEENWDYKNINVEKTCKKALINGRKVDTEVYRKSDMQKVHELIEHQGVDQTLASLPPRMKAFALLEAKVRNLSLKSEIRAEDKKYFDQDITEYLKMIEPVQPGSSKMKELHKALQRKFVATKFMELSGIGVDLKSYDIEISQIREKADKPLSLAAKYKNCGGR